MSPFFAFNFEILRYHQNESAEKQAQKCFNGVYSRKLAENKRDMY